MKELLLIKLGELVLKGLNRHTFEEKLVKNIKKSLKNICQFETKTAQSTVYIMPNKDFDFDFNLAIEKISNIFGIASICKAATVEKNLEEIKKLSAIYLENELEAAKTFKVETKRADKKFPYKSPEISALVGEYLLEKFPHLTVDVKNPDFCVNIEIRDFAAYICSQKVSGAKGMPVGSNGRATLLLSGGIDSPVAGYMIAKRGVEIDAVHFYSYPYTSERARDKVIKLAEILTGYTGKIRLFVVPFTDAQLAIYQNCPDDELTIIMRRVMMKIAEKIALKNKSNALITGESIGQVASQTIQSLGVTNAAVELPVFRPLIGMDKDEIVELARKIRTFETSILPYEDCCTVFVPKHPKTRPELEKILNSEKALDVDGMVEECVQKTELIIINGDDKN